MINEVIVVGGVHSQLQLICLSNISCFDHPTEKKTTGKQQRSQLQCQRHEKQLLTETFSIYLNNKENNKIKRLWLSELSLRFVVYFLSLSR